MARKGLIDRASADDVMSLVSDRHDPPIQVGVVLLLDADADLLDPAEREAITTLVQALQSVRQTNDAVVVEAATKALAKGTEDFAARRMNRGIQQALSGKNIATV